VGARREQRVELSLPVRIWGMDRNGKLFEEDVTTIDITPIGACLTGVNCNLQVGSVIGVQHGNSNSRFRVAWIGEVGSPRDHQFGILTVEPGKYIWGVALARHLGDFFRSESADIPADVAAVPKPAPHIASNVLPAHRTIRFGSDHRSVKRQK
jgi:hypothetical protein